MKYALYLRLLLSVTLVAAVATTGCKKKPKNPTPIPGASTGGVRSAEPETAVPPGGISTDTGAGGRDVGTQRPIGIDGQTPLPGTDPSNMRPNTNILAAYNVYFDFDRSTVRSSERSKIEAVANYLKEHPDNMLRVAGYCDERGTEGYNLALGERRALAVREYLIRLGISGERLFTISYGEAFPAVEGHTEAAFAKNRRCQFVVLEP